MSIIVQKFGGSSVGSLERIHHVAKKIKHTRDQGHDVVVIVSAMYGETDRLIQLAHALTPEPHPREYDALIATGEQVSITLLSMALHAIGCPARSLNGAQIGIQTDGVHTKARILNVHTQALTESLSQGFVVIAAGFQGVNSHGDITTLGRGGSDTSAVAIAVALNANECQIYTDVNGVYTTDPHFLPQAQPISEISFEEMLEMASLGAKVLQIRSVELASKHNLPIRVLSSFVEGAGTLVTRKEHIVDKRMISGITFNREEAMVTLDHLPLHANIETELLDAIAHHHIEIDMIARRSLHNTHSSFAFSVARKDAHTLSTILHKTMEKYPEIDVKMNSKISKLSLIGIGMRSHSHITSQLFKLLSQSSIHSHMMTTSEIRISILIDESTLEKAVPLVHSEFILNQSTPLEMEPV